MIMKLGLNPWQSSAFNLEQYLLGGIHQVCVKYVYFSQVCMYDPHPQPLITNHLCFTSNIFQVNFYHKIFSGAFFGCLFYVMFTLPLKFATPEAWIYIYIFFLTLLDLTDVCPLLTKQNIQVGLQIQYMFYNF
jgi:hypothetical protein